MTTMNDTLDGDVTTTRSLTALDRCDSCGAQAYIAVTLDSGELLFCAHHGHELEAKLKPVALDWHDESARLTQA